MSTHSSLSLALVSLALSLAPLASAQNVDVALKGTTLKLTGDDLGAEVLLTGVPDGEVNPVHAFVRLLAKGTTLNGGSAPLEFSGVKSVSLSLGDGQNAFAFQQVNLDGGISAKGGSGADSFLLSNSVLGGDFSVNGNKGEFDVSCLTGDVSGKFMAKGNSLPDSVLFSNCDVDGPTTIALGEGENQVEIEDSTFASLSIKTGSGPDGAAIADVMFAGKLKLDLGSGGNSLIVLGASATDGVSYKGGDGLDDVSLNPIASLGKVSFKLGGGANALEAGPMTSQLAESLSVSSGGGADVVDLHHILIGEDASFKLGNGNNVLVIQDCAIGDDLSVSMGSGDDSFTSNSPVGDKTHTNLGGGEGP